MTYNPSLRQIPRHQPADVLPTQEEPSILAWLENTGRLKPREPSPVEEEESEEIDDLIVDSDRVYDDDLSLEDED